MGGGVRLHRIFPESFLLLPDRCSIKEQGRQCVNPPEFVISILAQKDEYMVGVTCAKHKDTIYQKLGDLQKAGSIPQGQIKFETLKPVGTDCIKADPNDLIQLKSVREML
jgi:hypothetical protein